jgi:hypothetical protein
MNTGDSKKLGTLLFCFADCLAGYGGDLCDVCPENTYNDGTISAKAACTACESGSTYGATGSVSADACILI